MLATIQAEATAIAALCQRHHVRSLAVFGSALRDDFDPARSDLDFLVEFKPLTPSEHKDAYFGLIDDLEALFGRSVDLVEHAALQNPYLRRSIEQAQEPVYVAA